MRVMRRRQNRTAKQALNRKRARPVGLPCKSLSLPGASLALELRFALIVVGQTAQWRLSMLKGGLLWMVGIPLPIILILFFLGYLS